MITNMYNDYSPLAWDDHFSMDDADLDNQHKKLVDFYNDALDYCSGVKSVEREYFDKNINGFIKLMEKHCNDEERFFFDKQYLRQDEHVLEHKKLLEKIRLVKHEIQSDRWNMHLYILTITWKDWLMRHFNEYDKTAKEFFGANKSALPTEAEFAFLG